VRLSGRYSAPPHRPGWPAPYHPIVATEMVVAVYGPSQGQDLPPESRVFKGPQFEDQGPEVSFEDRVKVRIDTADDMKLGEIIDSAAVALGVSGPEGRRASWIIPIIGFFEPGWPPDPPNGWYYSLRTVDERGKPSWDILWQFIRVDELIASSRAGLFDGDPQVPCLWFCYPQGGAGPGFLIDLVSTWETLKTLVEIVGVGLGLGQIGRAIKERLDRGERVVSDRFDAGWSERLGRPQDLVDSLSSQARTAADVAKLLRCKPNEAEGILWSMGFVFEDGAWSPPRSDGNVDADETAARILFGAILEIRRLGRDVTPEELEALIRRLLQ
jgi:hypothetical protein